MQFQIERMFKKVFSNDWEIRNPPPAENAHCENYLFSQFANTTSSRICQLNCEPRELRGVRMFTGDKAAGMVGSIAEMFLGPNTGVAQCVRPQAARRCASSTVEHRERRVVRLLLDIRPIEDAVHEGRAARADSPGPAHYPRAFPFGPGKGLRHARGIRRVGVPDIGRQQPVRSDALAGALD